MVVVKTLIVITIGIPMMRKASIPENTDRTAAHPVGNGCAMASVKTWTAIFIGIHYDEYKKLLERRILC